MSAQVVTRVMALTCPHTGRRSLSGLTEKQPVKLRVGTQHVVTVEDAAVDGDYTGCTTIDTANNKHPCRTTAVLTKGAARLTVGSRPVLLTSDTITSVNDLEVVFPGVAVDTGPGATTLTAT